MNLRRTLLCLFAILILGMQFGCVAHKKKGESSKLSKFYHNTTAKYNGYFNANEIFEESILGLNQSFKDNYSQILPVFPYNAIDNVDAAKSKFDKAIEKVTVDITLHRKSRWTDDCYLLLAKSQYLKKDYETAENSFRYILTEFNPYKVKTNIKKLKAENEKNKKKEAEKRKKEIKKKAEEKAKAREKAKKEALKQKKKQAQSKSKKGSPTPKNESNIKAVEEIKTSAGKEPEKKENKDITNVGNRFVKHRPAYWEALVWSAKNLTERGKYFEAEQQLREVEKDINAGNKIKAELYASFADLYIKTKKSDKAIVTLQNAILHTKSKRNKSRYAFIIGQLYQQAKRYTNSDDYFNKCIKWKPDYDMLFHAKLNVLLNQTQSDQPGPEVASQLEKLLKDPKNSDYAPEIYFTIAKLYYKSNDIGKAKENLILAVRSPSPNTAQKAEAYYLLGDINFDEQDYLAAKNNYDSTLLFMVKNDSRRPGINALVKNLDEIAQQIEIITLEDSLIGLSKLTVKEKRALAIKLKNASKLKEAETNISLLERGGNAGRKIPGRFDINTYDNGLSPNDNPFSPAPKSNPNKPSTFFAYNQINTNRGRSEFEQTWGKRILEDNWRRSNKASFTFEEGKIENKENENTDSLEADLATFLKNIPSNAKELDAANKKIDDALFTLGSLYRSKINNYKKSKETLGSLLDRFPDTEHKVDAYYLQYLNCLDLEDNACAAQYSGLIMKDFSDTKYAKILSDPNFVKSLGLKKDELKESYEKAYALYDNKKYKECQEFINIAKTKLPDKHPLNPKFALLTAFCIGSLEGKEVYINSLRDLVANYPSTEEETKAKEILRFLKGDKDAFVEVTQQELEKVKFKVEDDKQHIAVIVLFDPQGNVERDIKFSISDYNANYHKTDNLKMTTITLDPDKNEPVFIIRKFDTKASAMKYYDGIQRKPKEFIKEFENYELYIISQNNYREVINLKSFKEYAVFFKQNYLKK